MDDFINDKLLKTLNKEELLYFYEHFNNDNLLKTKKKIFENKKEIIFDSFIKKKSKNKLIQIHLTKEKVFDEHNDDFLLFLNNHIDKNKALFHELFEDIDNLCDQLYDKIINGEEINYELYIKKEDIQYINNYFIKNYQITPLMLAMRHSYNYTTLGFLTHLLKNKIYFDIHYKNSFGKGLFDYMTHIKLGDYYHSSTNVASLLENLVNFYLNSLKNNDNKHINLNELGKVDKTGNTMLMRFISSANDDNHIMSESTIRIIFRFILKENNFDCLNLSQINHNCESLLTILSKKNNFYALMISMISRFYVKNQQCHQCFEIVDNLGNTPLIYLCKNRKNFTYLDSFYFFNMKIDFNYVDNNGNTALMYALKNKIRKNIVRRLFERWNGNNFMNHENESFFYLLCKNNFLDLSLRCMYHTTKNQILDYHEAKNHSALYYLIKHEIEQETKYYFSGKNKKMKKELWIENDFDNYLNSYSKENEFLSNNDIKKLIDNLDRGMHSKYGFLKKKLFERYLPILIDNNILNNDLSNYIPQLLY